ncbi:unnamed protein product [Phaedon cochleariae]|uniref:Lipase domain-containing protein n=1 Tax=Phaedon cochleariae TaxID=80249 RepID=A0A9P0DLK5_PHACE|nr:unnamed protein product [Phaedon cochleariae]
MKSCQKSEPDVMKIAILLYIVSSFLLTPSTAEDDPSDNQESENSEDTVDVFTKCYEHLGCVQTDSNWYHKIYRPINLKPADRHIIKTDFLLLKQSETDPESMLYNSFVAIEGSMKAAGFNNASQLMIIIHDFTGNGYSGWIKNLAFTMIKNALDYNLVSVDWQRGAEPPYDQALANSRVVALEIIALLKELKESMHYSFDNVHIVGHGVGAHIAGYVGGTYNKIKKITGLDPNGPRFHGMPNIVKLNPDCAKYVEVIHTDSYDSRSQGINESLGHSDFYVNSAPNQPGCSNNPVFSDLLSVDRSNLKEGQILPGCSHKRSFKYFIEAVSNGNCTFMGISCDGPKEFDEGRCNSCNDSGRDCKFFGLKTYMNAAQNIKYYLNSGDQTPYCMFQYRMNISIKGDSKVGYFDFILVDEHANVAEAVLTSESSSNYRDIKGGQSNIFVYYAHPPKLGPLKEAKVRWNEEKKFYCILFCKQSITVDKITVNFLGTGSEDGRYETVLCPTNGEMEIENGSYKTFTNCSPKSKSSSTAVPKTTSSTRTSTKMTTKKVNRHKHKS